MNCGLESLVADLCYLVFVIIESAKAFAFDLHLVDVGTAPEPAACARFDGTFFFPNDLAVAA